MSTRSNRKNKKMFRVCMLSAEVQPYVKVGGLADVVGALAAALESEGLQIKIIVPLYRRVRERCHLSRLGTLDAVTMGERSYPVGVFAESGSSEPRVYFVENDEFFDREGIYTQPETGEGYRDNFERFNFFQLAALELLRLIDWKPQVLHCHDSHTALVPAYLKLGRMGQPFYKDISTVLTIHNLAFQGLFDADRFRLTGLPSELFYPMGPFEFYNQLNCLKAGICYADVLNTVSPHYAREIQTAEFGCGLESVLRQRQPDLYGILNGIDVEEWNPETDPLIAARFSAGDLRGKRENKRRLQEELQLPVLDLPLIGIVSRLTEQKGFDLILEIGEELAGLECQWVILGAGLKRYQNALQNLARRHPQHCSVRLGYDNRMAHQIEAGADLFLMPSRYEPCGLSQLYSLRYGTIPVVRHTGGLADTVQQFEPASRSGNGFKFYDYKAAELLRVLRQALETWKDQEVWEHLIRNAMSQDFSWNRSAQLYLQLYEKAISHP